MRSRSEKWNFNAYLPLSPTVVQLFPFFVLSTFLPFLLSISRNTACSLNLQIHSMLPDTSTIEIHSNPEFQLLRMNFLVFPEFTTTINISQQDLNGCKLVLFHSVQVLIDDTRDTEILHYHSNN